MTWVNSRFVSRGRASLYELDANAVGRSPRNAAIPLHEFRFDEQRELIGNADGAIDFQRCARGGHISDGAIHGCGGARRLSMRAGR